MAGCPCVQRMTLHLRCKFMTFENIHTHKLFLSTENVFLERRKGLCVTLLCSGCGFQITQKLQINPTLTRQNKKYDYTFSWTLQATLNVMVLDHFIMGKPLNKSTNRVPWRNAVFAHEHICIRIHNHTHIHIHNTGGCDPAESEVTEALCHVKRAMSKELFFSSVKEHAWTVVIWDEEKKENRWD